MIRFEYSGLVRKPPQVVFDLACDFTKLPDYDPDVEWARKTSRGAVREGSRWRYVRVVGGREIEAEIEMVEFDPPRRFVMQSAARGFEMTSTMTFEPSGRGATRLTERMEMQLSGMFRLLQPVVAPQVPKQANEVHRRFKEYVEAYSTP